MRGRTKKIFLVLALCLAVAACWAVPAIDSKLAREECIDFIAYGRADIPLVDVRTGREILARFPEELELVREETGTAVSELTDDTFHVIQSVALAHLNHPDLDFPALVQEISNAAAEYRVSLVNSEAEVLGARAARNHFEILNFKQTVLVPFGALSGRVDEMAAMGQAATPITNTPFDLPAGTAVKGFSLTAHFSIDVPDIVASGPVPNIPLHGVNRYASHIAYLSVLNGVLVKETYDIYDPDADTTYHVNQVVIVSASTSQVALLYAMGTPTCIQHANQHITLQYANELEFRDAVQNYPERFVG